MKKLLSIFAVAVVFAACKTKTSEPVNKNMVLVDTTGLSQSNVLTDIGNNKYVISQDAINKPGVKPVIPKRTTAYKSGSSSSSNAYYSSENNATQVKQDKGWSHAAKGTVVGAGTGAIFGAIVNKEHRGQGALIGSVIGAGAGYLIGRKTDQNTGRVARAKARKAAAANQ